MEQKNDSLLDRIASDPEILHGKPCVRGTRIPVYLIVSLVAAGESFDKIISDYPSLTKDDLVAALRYAARLAEYEAFAL